MREIKFRAWDEKKKAMLYEGEEIAVIDFHSGASLSYKLQSWDILKSYDIVMQYTGLKDKNGKEIYEGDFIEYSLTSHEKRAYRDKVFWVDDVCGFEPFVSYDSEWPIYVDLKTLKVIGNIYKNPELLENK